jgi:hypothetical protein
VPVKVPPEPEPATNISTLPSVSFHISGPIAKLQYQIKKFQEQVIYQCRISNTGTDTFMEICLRLNVKTTMTP